MSPRTTLWLPGIVAVLLVSMFGSSPAAAQPFDSYKGLTLGSSASDIVVKAPGSDRDGLKTLHARPALLQELSWRLASASNRQAAGLESVSRIIFSFMDDRLFKMVIEYDPAKTEGLTKTDMIASVSEVYGTRSPLRPAARRQPGYEDLLLRTAIAEWRQADTLVVLSQAEYATTYALTVVNTAMEAAARKAEAAALVLDAREAPAREAAQAKAQAAADKAAAEQTRTTNKATFKP